MNKAKVWLVTGSSTGFGRCLVEELLKKGERVVATARNPQTLEGLKAFAQKDTQLLIHKLDVNVEQERFDVVSAANNAFGQIDVLVNNAGYGLLGALEEVKENEIRNLFDTNVFSLMLMTQAVLPTMRKQKSGHILNLSSIAGFSASSGFGIYNATKFAVEGHSESLAQELAPFGIKVSIIEPGPFRTDFAGRSLVVSKEMPEYAESSGVKRKYFAKVEGTQAGDPVKAALLMISIVEKKYPLRVPMGNNAVDRIKQKLDDMKKDILQIEAEARATDY